MSAELRVAGGDDLDAVLALDRACSPVFSQRSAYGRLLKTGGLLMLALEEDRLLGFAACSRVLDQASLLNLVVRPGQRRRGLARGLLGESIRQLAQRGVKRLLLEVRESNASARALYSAMGFCVDAERGNYYPGRDDATVRESAVLMSLNLENADACA